MTSIRPCLWFDGQAEEAAALYVSLFPGSKILSVFRYPEGSPMPAGEVATVDFVVAGLPVQLLNGGPHFKLSEAFSLSVDVDGGQEEVDRLWDALIAGGGEPSQCGWLKDRFGVSWQIVPRRADPGCSPTRTRKLLLGSYRRCWPCGKSSWPTSRRPRKGELA